MNDVQSGMLDLLIEIDDICSSNGITYYLGGGTALGAVRHQGFLPWDDDADLYITRDNWKKLLSVIDRELADNRELVCSERFPNYRNPIGRYMNLDSTWIYQSQMFSGAPSGQHIEFLILDPLPSNEALHRQYFGLFQVYNELMGSYFVVNRVVSRRRDIFDLELYKYWKSRMVEFGREAVLNELEDRLFCYTEDDCSFYHLRHGFEFHVYSKKNFGKQRYVPFETIELPVAEFAEGVFREAYGDSWKKIPDFENQVTHNPISSLEVPYTEYWRRSFSLIDREEVLDTQIRWKELSVELIPAKNQVADDYGKMKSFLDGVLSHYLYMSNDIAYTGSDFEKYYKMQACMDAEKNDFVFDVSPRFIEQAFSHWLRGGIYWKPLKLMGLSAFSSKFKSINQDYLNICTASRAIDASLDVGAYAEALKLAEPCGSEFRKLSPLADHAELASILNDGKISSDLLGRVESLLAQFPDYSYFKYVKALLLEGSDRCLALALYRELADKSFDGLIVLGAKARLKSLRGE